MNPKINKSQIKKLFTSLAVATGFLAGSAIAAAPAKAVSFYTATLKDENSVADFILDMESGFMNWVVDGKDHLFSDYYYYRIGNTAEKSISSLQISNFGTTDSDDEDAEDDVLTATFSDAAKTFSIDLEWRLDGSPVGSGVSNVEKQITIKNTGSTALRNFNLFSYTDLDLTETPNNDTVVIANINAFYQQDAEGTIVDGTQNSRPSKTFYESAVVPTTLNKLQDGSPTTLSNTKPFGQELGEYNVATAWQWQYDLIGVGRAATIGQSLIITAKTPEPSAMLALFAVGSLGFGLKRKKQQVAKS